MKIKIGNVLVQFFHAWTHKTRRGERKLVKVPFFTVGWTPAPYIYKPWVFIHG
ncbi:hypothetical protein MAL1_00200 [Bacteriophage DSS3_MAL1]|nr:hypothetical protein MAL1_00200 [Bacteriophage DSS3_MAL1]